MVVVAGIIVLSCVDYKKPSEQRHWGFLRGLLLGFQFSEYENYICINSENDKRLGISRQHGSYLGNLFFTFIGIYLYILFKTPMTYVYGTHYR